MDGLLADTPFAVIPGATLAGLLAGALLPLLGLWVVLQRVVFLGVTLAQVAAAGVALGLFLHLPALPLGFALCALVIAGLLVRRTSTGLGTGGDAALGAIFCAASALSLLFIARSPADMDQVHHVLHGNLIFALPRDVWALGCSLGGGVALLLLAFPRVLFTAFDAETAAALGLRTRLWQLLLFGVLAGVLTTSTRTTGSLLSFSLLVLPPLAALQLPLGLRGTFLAASLLGLFGAALGLVLAVEADLHLESSITVTCFALVAVCAALRVHVVLGLAAATLTALVCVALLVDPDPLHDSHDHGGATHLDDTAVHASLEAPFIIDVHVGPRLGRLRRAADGSVQVGWSLALHRHDPDGSLPPALWLVVTAGDTRHEEPLLEETAGLPAGDVERRGSFVLVPAAQAQRLEGQIWTGPLDDLEAVPLVEATVVGCALD